MTDRELMRLALNALITAELDGNCEYGVTDALRARLAQPEPEPVAWMLKDADWFGVGTRRTRFYTSDIHDGIPLYTAPPQREWQGLTTAERKALWNVTKKPSEFGVLIEAKLREKNELR